MSRAQFRRPVLWLMAGLLAIAAAVRFRAIQFGLPHTQARPDETAIIDPVRTLLSGHLPNFFDYPWLFLWMVAIAYVGYYLWGAAAGTFHSLGDMVASWPVHWEPFFLIPRVISATAGVISVWLIFRLGRRFGKDAVGLVAALFLALAFMHTRSSHFGTTDVVMTLFIIAAVTELLDAHHTRNPRTFAIAGLFAGLAAATKYNAVLLVVPMLVSYALAMMETRRKQLNTGGTQGLSTGMLYGLAAFAVAFAIGVPFVVLDNARFMAAMYELGHALRVGDVRQDLGNGWVNLLTLALRHGVGIPMLVAGLAGMIMICWLQPRDAAVLFSFPLAYYVVAGSVRLLFFRYAMPLVPFVCIGAAYFVCQVAEWAARSVAARAENYRLVTTTLTAVLALVVVWEPAALTWEFDRVMSAKDNRVVVAQWFFDHVPTESTVLQTGSRYGLVQFWDRRFTYREWRWDGVRNTFLLEGRRLGGADRPDWIVVQESPLPSTTQDIVKSMLPEYTKVADFAAFTPSDDLVYDQLDAFFVPFAGLEHVERPGPNFSVYKHERDVAAPRAATRVQ